MASKPNPGSGALKRRDFNALPIRGEKEEADKPAHSRAAMRLFDEMQTVDFADGAAEFMSMSPKEMGEAARKAVAVRKASR